MVNRTKAAVSGLAVIGLLILSSGNTLLHGMEPDGAAAVRPAPPARRAAHAPRKASAPRMSGDECSALALEATLAKARAEMRVILPSGPSDLGDIGGAMNSDHRLSENIKRAFANSDVVASEFSNQGECVVTLKLSVNRLRRLARDL